MPECPKCGKKLSFLGNVEIEEITSTFYGSQDYDVTNVKVVSSIWKCPECGEKLFDSKEDAMRFLEHKE